MVEETIRRKGSEDFECYPVRGLRTGALALQTSELEFEQGWYKFVEEKY